MKALCPGGDTLKVDSLNPGFSSLFVTGSQSRLWEKTVFSIAQWMKQQQLISPHLTVVLPFVQLIAPAQRAWGRTIGDGFMPRFETTQTWAVRLGGLHQAGAGPTGDAVTDYLQARKWLGKIDDISSHASIASTAKISALAQALVMPLVDMAGDLVAAAGALPPAQRHAYWQRAAERAQQVSPGIASVEAALGPLAVAWAGATEGWSSDILFQQAKLAQHECHIDKKPSPNAQAELAFGDDDSAETRKGLVVIQAGGEDALTRNLYEQWPADLRLWINLDELPLDGLTSKDQEACTGQTSELDYGSAGEPADEPAMRDPLALLCEQHAPAWQIADDAEDEAQRAAAQVITLLNQGVMPVALCTQDRPVARRVWALLNRQQIPLADETGWTLSTTRAAALVMGMLRCGVWNTSTDNVLDALKALPASSEFTAGLGELESRLRKMAQAAWPKQAPDFWPEDVKAMFARASHLCQILQTSSKRSLWLHLQALNQALQYSTADGVLQRDEAGREVLQTLHCYDLDTPDAPDTSDMAEGGNHFAAHAKSTPLTYAEFTSWVSYALEGMTFIPPAPDQPQVIFTPLARMMLRPFAAAVIPGCDDARLTRPPQLPGFWREQDRVSLGLMNYQRWWKRLQAQWLQALRLPNVTLLWRRADGSEPLGPASLVQRVVPASVMTLEDQDVLTVNEEVEKTQDKRLPVYLQAQSTVTPAPKPANRLTMKMLSASAYQKLRDCPYKFYAEQLLALRESNELDDELDKRDYGNWVHQILSDFHQSRGQRTKTPTLEDDVRLLDKCASRHIQKYDPAAFIPWAALWPAIAQNYLHWLRNYEAGGAHFEYAETTMQYHLAGRDTDILLQGRIDRIDRKEGHLYLIDYKTERYNRTKDRVKDAFEDVQLPFYALLAQGHIQGQSTQEGAQTITTDQEAQAFYLSLDDRQNQLHEVALDNLDEAKDALQQGIVSDIGRLVQGHAAHPLGTDQICQFCAVKGLCRKAFWDDTKEPSVLKVAKHVQAQDTPKGQGDTNV